MFRRSHYSSRSRSATARIPGRKGTVERGLAHNLSYAVAGQVGYVASQLGVLSAIGHFKGPEAIGEFGIALAITTPLFMLANMGLRTGQASDVHGKFAFSDYAGLVILTAITAAAVSIGIGYAFSATPSMFLILVIFSITKAFEAVSHVSYGAFQQAGRMDKVASSLVIRGAITVVVFVALLSAGVGMGPAFLAQLFVWGVLAAAYDYPRACQITSGAWVWPTWSRDRTVKMMLETAPVGAGHFMNSLLVSLPRIFVERILGLEAVGLFTVVAYFQQAAKLVINAVSQALVNHLARFRRDGKLRTLRSAGLVLFGAAILISASGLLFVHYAGEVMLGLLFGPEFTKMSDVLMAIALAVCAKLFAVLPQSLMHADRRFKAYFWYQAASLVVCICVLSVFVPLWGLMGAGYAVLVVALFRLAVLIVATAISLRGLPALTVRASARPQTGPA